jgi:hypothetical protein
MTDVVRGNGQNDPTPRCSWNERRIEHTAQLATETRGALSAVASTVDHLRSWSSDFEARALREFDRLSTAVASTDMKLDRLLEGLAIGQVRNGFDEGDITKVQDRPTIVGRAKVAEHRALTLEEENAALRATIEATDRERARNSEHARTHGTMSISRWKITAGLVLGIVAAVAAIAQAVASAVGG